MDKRHIFAKMLAHYHDMLERTMRARNSAQSDANDHKGRIESRYDTFREEAQYLAGGQEKRRMELEETIRGLEQFVEACPFIDTAPHDGVRPGALVQVSNEQGCQEWYLMIPRGGGISIDAEFGTLTTINAGTPLGRALHGLSGGQEVAFETAGQIRHLRINAVY